MEQLHKVVLDGLLLPSFSFIKNIHRWKKFSGVEPFTPYYVTQVFHFRQLHVLEIGFWKKKFDLKKMSKTRNDDEKRLLQQVSNDVEGESSKRSREWSLNGAEVV